MAHPLCWVPYMARSRAVSRSCKGLYAAYRLIDAADISHCASVIKAGEISIEFYRPTFFDPSIRNHRSATTYNETTRHFWSSNLVCSQTNFLSLQLTLTRLLSDDCWWLWQLFLPRTWRNPSWLIPMRSVNPQQSWHGKQGTLKWAFLYIESSQFFVPHSTLRRPSPPGIQWSFLRAEHAFPVFVDKETWCCECSWHQISIPHLLIIWSFSPFSNHSPSIFQAILMVFPCLSDDFPSCCSSNFSASIFSSDRWVQVSVPRSTCFATHPPPSMVLNHRDTKLFRTRFYPHHLLQLAWHGEKIGKKKTYIEHHFCPLFFPQASSTLINPMVFWWLWPPNPTRFPPLWSS